MQRGSADKRPVVCINTLAGYPAAGIRREEDGDIGDVIDIADTLQNGNTRLLRLRVAFCHGCVARSTRIIPPLHSLT